MKQKIISISINNYKKIGDLNPEVHGESVGIIRFIGKSDKHLIKDIGEHEIVVIDDYPPHIPSKNNPVGIIRAQEIGISSHAAVKARFWGIPTAIADDITTLKDLDGQWVYFKANQGGVVLRIASEHEIKNYTEYLPKIKKPQLARIENKHGLKVLSSIHDMDTSSVGYKVSGLARICLSKVVIPQFIKINTGMVVPYDFEHHINRKEYPLIGAELDKIGSNLNADNVEESSQQARTLILNKIDDSFTWGILEKQIRGKFSDTQRFHVRTSTNAEDLPDYPGVGASLYDTYTNISFSELREALINSRASIWGKEALMENTKLGIEPQKIAAAQQIIPTVIANHSFIIHTVNPDTKDKNIVLFELVEGQCDSITSSLCSGKGYIYEYNKLTKELKLKINGSKTHKVVYDTTGGTKLEKVNEDTSYYSRPETLSFIKNILTFACDIERFFSSPQDIEGSIVNNKHDEPETTHIFQSRVETGFQASNEWIHEISDRLKSLEQEIKKTNDYGHAIISAQKFLRNIQHKTEGMGRDYFINSATRTFHIIEQYGDIGYIFLSACLFSSPKYHLEVQELIAQLPLDVQGKLLYIACTLFSPLIPDYNSDAFKAYSNYSLSRFILSSSDTHRLETLLKSLDKSSLEILLNELTQFVNKIKYGREEANVKLSLGSLQDILQDFISSKDDLLLLNHPIFNLQ